MAGKKAEANIETFKKDLELFREERRLEKEELQRVLAQTQEEVTQKMERKMEQMMSTIVQMFQPGQSKRIDPGIRIGEAHSDRDGRRELGKEPMAVEDHVEGTESRSDPIYNNDPPMGLVRGGGYRDEEPPVGFARGGEYRRDCRTRRIEMPVFSGEDPDGWIYRVERFFSVGRFTDEEKMELVAMSMEKEALTWFRWVNGRRQILDWEECKKLVTQKFRPAHEGSQCQRLLAVKQIGTIAAYTSKFLELAAPLTELPEPVLESVFLNGLQDEIRLEMQVLEPKGLSAMMKMSQQIEERNRRVGSSKWRNKRGEVGNKNSVIGLGNTREQNQNKSVGTGKYKRLTLEEMNEKRAKGLYFRCDDKFTPGHKCRNVELRVMLVIEGDEELDELEDEGMTEEAL